jgi:hypothetical protein
MRDVSMRQAAISVICTTVAIIVFLGGLVYLASTM